VLHLIDHLGPGGAQTLLLDLLEARPAGSEHVVVSLTDRALPHVLERLRRTDVPWQSLHAHRRPLRALLELRSRLRQWKPHVLHTQLDASNTFGPLCAFGMKSGRPALVLAIENDPALHYGRVLRATLPFAVARADLTIVLAESLGRAAGRALAGARRVEIVQPGIDLDHFRRGAVDPEAVRSIRKGASVLIGSVGRLTRQKGYDVLLDALPAIRASHPGARLVLAGDGEERATLARQADRLGVAASVDLLGHLDDVRPVLAALDLFVSPSRHEGFGLIFLEAMAMGVPVVGTRVVGSRDAVQHGETGVLVDPEDPGALAAGVLEVLADERTRSARAREAARRVALHGSRSEMARRIYRLYEEIGSTALVSGPVGSAAVPGA
jgi:glycosyltransferase involved in cell wall biosynthesis